MLTIKVKRANQNWELLGTAYNTRLAEHLVKESFADTAVWLAEIWWKDDLLQSWCRGSDGQPSLIHYRAI